MVESPAHRSSVLSRASIFATAICAAVLAFSAVAQAGGPAPRAPLPVPNGFAVEASDGYELYGFAGPPLKGTGGSLTLVAASKGRQVAYEAPATITETSIEADLGELGEVSIEFHPSRRAAAVPCGPRPIKYDSGTWVGTIDFHGEGGYTSVETSSAPGHLEPFLPCAAISGEGGSSLPHGVALSVRNPGLGASLSVFRTRSSSEAVITARLTEYSDEISIERATAVSIPSHDFTYDRRLRKAGLTPPAPFAGSAHLDLDAKAGRRWSGNLTVDLPGREDVPLTDPILRATLSAF